MNEIAVINACSDLGVNVSGANLGAELITQNTKESIYKVEAKKVDKEYEKDNRKKNLVGVNEFNNRLYNKIKEIVEEGYLPVTIGGDHSIAIASALASINKHKKMGVIWFDAHADFNTFDTTITGNIHGLPLAAITNYEKNYLTEFHKRKLL